MSDWIKCIGCNYDTKSHMLKDSLCSNCRPKFLEVAPNQNAPEGIYSIRVEAIKGLGGTISSKFLEYTNKYSDNVIVSEQLEILVGQSVIYKAIQDNKKTIVARVVNTRSNVINKFIKNLIVSHPRPKCLVEGCVGINHHSWCPDFSLIKHIKQHGILSPITIDNQGRVINGYHRLWAAHDAGLLVIPCVLGTKDTVVMNTCKPDLKKPEIHLNGHPYVSFLIRDAESFGAKAIAEMVDKVILNSPIPDKKHPSERGLVRCLETSCKTWIPDAKQYKVDRESGDWFCKKHKSFQGKNIRGFADFPLIDRDGDTIWIMKEFEVIKIKSMEDSHLTNTLVMLETNSKKRCYLTGLPETKWLNKAGPRYPLLLEEAKRRDKSLMCKCDDGILQLQVVDPETLKESTETSLCSNCVRGEDRRKAKQLANIIAKDNASRKKSFTIQVATMMIIALMAGGCYYGGMEFVGLVLKELNLIK